MNSKILVVDDSALARRAFLAKPLRAAGYQVIEAVNGQEGLAAWAKHKPDLVITDLLMPELDGFGFVHALRDAEADCPIIVASADIQDSSRKRVAALDTFGFLNKPFRYDELLQMVSDALSFAPAAGE
ncbi:MAG: response regulator [Planctomycetaceae bacterium]|nr:response regulator [Planctomycetaceae bacterium]